MSLPELPLCPVCREVADPRWYYRGVMLCDGCCPRPGARSPVLDALLQALENLGRVVTAPCAACGHVGQEAPPSGQELPVVAGALDAQAESEQTVFALRGAVARLEEAHHGHRVAYGLLKEERDRLAAIVSRVKGLAEAKALNARTSDEWADVGQLRTILGETT